MFISSGLFAHEGISLIPHQGEVLESTGTWDLNLLNSEEQPSSGVGDAGCEAGRLISL